MAEKDRLIAEKDRLIAEKDQFIANRDDELQRMFDLVSARDEELKKKSEQLDAKDVEMARMKEMLEGKRSNNNNQVYIAHRVGPDLVIWSDYPVCLARYPAFSFRIDNRIFRHCRISGQRQLLIMQMTRD